MLYSRNTNISGNIIKHYLRTSMNERTHSFIKKIYLSHFILERVHVSIITQLLLLTIARCVIFKNQLNTSSTPWLGSLNRGSLRAIAISGAFSVCKLPGLLVTNWLNCRRRLSILFHSSHLLPLLLPFIYTGTSLIDGSVKGQYITLTTRWRGHWLTTYC